MGLLRSEPMKHGTLVVPVERAREFIDLIGKNTKMQFEDMNVRDMHRPYKKYIQRIDEMERIIRFLLEELTRVPGAEVVKNNVDAFLDHSDSYKLDEVESELLKIHKEFIQFKENNAKLQERRNAALEECYVVQTAIASMAHVPQASSRLRSSGGPEEDEFEYEASRSLLDEERGVSSRRTLETMFSSIAGVIHQEEQDRFARMLFRATRGNTFTHFQQIFEPMQDPKTGREVHKSVFVIYFQDHRMGSAASAMSEKINKICSSFGVHTYRWPASRTAAQERHSSLKVQVEDQRRLLKAHEHFVHSEAASLLEPTGRGRDSLIEEWRLFCVKEKAIYHTLNLFEGNMNLRASCWYPAAEEDNIRALCTQHFASQRGHSSAVLMPHRSPPRKQAPTYIRVNEFTSIFQTLVDTYGLPRYQEANPALFTLVTFPFLFGVMYGDIGHGLMLLSVGIFAMVKKDELKYSFPTLYQARYILTMMGIFAVYCGFLYNDFFSLGLSLFQSRWSEIPADAKQHETVVLQPKFDRENRGGMGPYPFGLDPAWHGAQNELVYLNSMKMKLSVVLGVVQMFVGLLLRFANALYDKNMVDFWCECVPMLIFMLGFFGFMDYMILYKWVTPLSNPPSIINSMIAMAMWTEDPNPMFGNDLPKLLMGTCMLAVPFMLIPKPVILNMRHKASRPPPCMGPGGLHGFGSEHMRLSDEESLRSEDEEEVEEFDLTECVIHQVIETIEYVLGTVSHTASYLRLWALSLAHQQLSLVFFGMTLLSGMGAPFPLNIIATYVAFYFWFASTVGILLGMDVMECFLHTLRLHWVEFQSKFYKADGYAFTPFCHRDLLRKETDD
ncbi:VHA-a3 [Symbiodinium sp. CCMP2592]|nr:VHA-a3 [Symbiodinium sp. CCMP2592]